MSELKMELRNDVDAKDFFQNQKHMIEYAFSFGDRHYFRFSDAINTPYDRALKTLVYYREMDMNVDRQYLTQHTMAIDNLLKKPKLTIDDLLDIRTLNEQMKQRLQLPKEPELMYKLASVVFFDQRENPYIYDFKYGSKKIAFWKKHASLDAFFLQKPLQELIPYLQHAGENLNMFSAMASKVAKAHSEEVWKHLSEQQRMTLQDSVS